MKRITRAVLIRLIGSIVLMCSAVSLQAQLDTVGLQLQDQYACVGDTIVVPITVTNFHNIDGVQLRILWDINELNFIGSCDEAYPFINVNNAIEGQATVFGIDFSGVTTMDLMDNDTLLNIKFTVLDLSASLLALDFSPVGNELVVFNGTQALTYPLDLEGASIQLNEVIQLQTTSSFITCTDSLAELSAIADVSPSTFLWSGPGGFSANTAVVNVSQDSIYTVIAQHGNCTDTASISLQYDTLSPVILNSQTGLLTCENPIFPLEVELQNTTDVAYTWITPANDTITTPSAILNADSIGDYTFIATNLLNGCVARDTLMLEQDVDFPDLSLSDTLLMLNCSETSYMVYAASSMANVSYLWLDQNDNQQAQTDSLFIDQAGTYLVQVTNLDNQCTAEDFVVVNENYELPDVSIQGNDPITCADTLVTLTASPNTTQMLHYTWLDASFSVLSTNDSLELSTAAEWILIAEHAESHCLDTLSVFSTTDTLATNFSISSTTDTLNCITNSATVTVQATTPNVSIEWLDMNQSILGMGTSITLDSAGDYSVQLTNSDNACVSQNSFSLAIDTIFPDLSLSDTLLMLNCSETSYMVYAASSTANVSYLWLDQNDNQQAQTDSLFIDQAGTYLVQVTNLDNQCTAEDFVVVNENYELPDVSIQGNDPITCADTLVTLTASPNTTQMLHYTWLDTSFSVLSTNDSLELSTAAEWILIAEHAESHCLDTLSVFSTTDTLAANFSISSTTDTLNCITNSATVTVQTATPNVSIEWLDMNQSILGMGTSIALDSAGDYSVQLTNTDNACVSQNSFSLAIDTIPPDLILSPNDTLTCMQESITLSISSSLSDVMCEWIGHNNTCELTTQSGGTFTAMLTNNLNGCTSTDSVEVIDLRTNPNTTIQASNMLDCQNNTVILQTVDTLVHTHYEWLTADGMLLSESYSAQIDESGVYYLSLVDTLSNCSSLDSITITDNTMIPNVVLSVSDSLSCNTPLVELLASQLGNDVVLSWESLGGTPLASPFVDTEGLYIATLEDTLSHCVVMDTVEVFGQYDLPVFSWSIDQNLQPLINCYQEEITALAASSMESLVSFHWETMDGDIVGQTPSFTFTAAANLNLVATHSISGCTIDSLVQVTEDIVPPVIQFNDPDPLDCVSNETTLSSVFNPDYIYEWSADAPDLVESPNEYETIVLGAATYSLQVTDTTNGCENQSNILIDDVNAGPQNANITIHQPECDNGAQIGHIFIDQINGGTAPFSYSLAASPFSAQTAYTDLNTGAYPLSVLDANGCTWDTLLTIHEAVPLEVLIAADTTSIHLGGTAHLSFSTNVNQGLSEIHWQIADGAFIDSTETLSVSPLQTTTYQLNISSNSACTASDVITIFVVQKDPIYIPNVFSPNADGSNDEFMFFCDQSVAQIDKVMIFDRWGSEVFVRNSLAPYDNKLWWDGKYNEEKAASGVYVYMIELTLIDGSKQVFTGDLTLVY